MALLINIASEFTQVIEPIGTVLGSIATVLAGWAVISDIRRSDDGIEE